MTLAKQSIHLRFSLSPRQVLLVVFAVLAISSILLVASAIAHQLADASGDRGLLYKVLVRLNVGDENNLGAWFSSTLLALIAATAVLCLIAERATGRGIAGLAGWSLVALLFAALSLDELGSLHERVPDVGDVTFWAIWLVPFVSAIPVFMGVFGYLRLRHRRLSLALLALGILAFCLVPLQEYLEFLPADGVRRQAWQLVAEEGSELLGMTAFLAALLFYVVSDPAERRQTLVVRELSFNTSGVLLSWIVAVTALVLSILCWTMATLWPFEGDLFGTLENWPSVAVATGLALFCAALAHRTRPRGNRRAALSICAFAVVASAFVGANLYARTDNETLVWALRGAMILVTLVTLGGAAFAMQGRSRLYVAGAIATVVIGCAVPDSLVPHLLIVGITLAALAAIGLAERAVDAGA